MKKTIKDLFKLITTIATVAGILYVARDQIKAIIAKIKEVSDDDFDDDFIKRRQRLCFYQHHRY